MSTTSACALALIVVLVLVVVGVLAAKSRRASWAGEGFSTNSGSQASVVTQIKSDLESIDQVSRGVLEYGNRLQDRVAKIKFDEVAPSIRVLLVPISWLNTLLNQPDISNNVLRGVYDGLKGGNFEATSRLFETTGASFEKIANGLSLDESERVRVLGIGYMLRSLGDSVANISGSVQMLGSYLAQPAE
jgi:hypothetical protein